MASPNFTPVRRPQPRIYNKLVDDDDGSVWTATRCQRLLRSLTSRIATIRKKHEHYFERERAAIVTAEGYSNVTRTTEAAESITIKHRDQEKGDDPDWAPGRPAKRRRNTYSTRGIGGRPRGRPVRNGATGEVGSTKNEAIISTPRIHIPKLLSKLATPASKEQPGAFNYSSPAVARKKRRAVPVSRSQNEILRGSEHIWDGIKSSLDSILLATAPVSEMSRKERRGTRSLFASCLSKVPRYILDGQDAVDEDEEMGPEDVADAVYTHLESLSLNQGAGWKPLRQVVRAHAIEILAEAVRELLIPFHIATEWAFLCARKDSVDEGVRILEALIETQIEHNDTLSSSEQNFESLVSALKDFGALYNRGHLLWRFIEATFTSGYKGLRWLMDHRRQDLWTRCMDPIFQEPSPETKASVFGAINMVLRCAVTGSHSDISTLVHTIRLKVHQSRHSRRARPVKLTIKKSSANTPNISPMPYMFLSIMDALATIIILRPVQANPVIALRQSLFRHISLVKEIMTDSATTEFQECIRFMPTLALNVTEAYTDVGLAELPEMETYTINTVGAQHKSQITDILARLVTSIAENCGAASGQEPSSFFETFGRHLVDLASKTNSRDLAHIAVASAFDFAERHPETANLDLALEFELEIDELIAHDRSDDVPATPLQADTKNPPRAEAPFRWEQSISEWVAKTPHVHQTRASTHVEHSRARLKPTSQTATRHSTRTFERSNRGRNESQNYSREHEPRRYNHVESSDEWSIGDDEAGRDCRSSTPGMSAGSTDNFVPPSNMRPRQAIAERPKRFLGQVKVPPVSNALKRCISEPSLKVEPVVKRQRRTRLSHDPRTAFYTREGRRISDRRTSVRLVGRVKQFDAENESEDELGI